MIYETANDEIKSLEVNIPNNVTSYVRQLRQSQESQ